MVGRAGTVPGHEVGVHDPAEEGEERQENNHPVTCQGPIPRHLPCPCVSGLYSISIHRAGHLLEQSVC